MSYLQFKDTFHRFKKMILIYSANKKCRNNCLNFTCMYNTELANIARRIHGKQLEFLRKQMNGGE